MTYNVFGGTLKLAQSIKTYLPCKEQFGVVVVVVVVVVLVVVVVVLIYRPRRDGKLGWPWVAGWLHPK